jgi:hypothetical protein
VDSSTNMNQYLYSIKNKNKLYERKINFNVENRS